MTGQMKHGRIPVDSLCEWAYLLWLKLSFPALRCPSPHPRANIRAECGSYLAWFVINLIIDFWFVFDILIELRTGYVVGGHFVKDDWCALTALFPRGIPPRLIVDLPPHTIGW